MTRADPISLRLPPELRKRLDATSKDAGRSLNAEIRMRLEFSYEVGFAGEATDKMLANEIESLRSEMRGGLGVLREELSELRRRIADLEAKP